MSQDLPQDIQQKIRNFQVLQANMQSLTEQKVSLDAQLKEITSAREYLGSLPSEATIYKSIGGLMVKTPKDKAELDLKESEEVLSTRVKKLAMTVERTQSKYDELKNEINTSLKNRM